MTALFVMSAWSLFAKNRLTFSLPDSLLLFAMPYYDVRLVRPGNSLILPSPMHFRVGSGAYTQPSLAPNGDLVAWGYPMEGTPLRLALGLYLVSEGKWTTYPAYEGGTPAISPDSSRVAFASSSSHGLGLQFLDVATGRVTRVRNADKFIPLDTMSWSPDGNRLVFSVWEGKKDAKMVIVFNLDTENAQKVGEGKDPAWSPTGEWIAYIDSNGEKCMLVHPDGTGTKIARDAGRLLFGVHNKFLYAVVWSPDGKKLLLNRLDDFDTGSVDVLLLDLETGRMDTKSKNGLPVFGWAPQRK